MGTIHNLAEVQACVPETYERTIETITVEIRELKQTTGDAIFGIGQRLTEANEALVLLALPQDERERFLSEPHMVDGQETDVIDMSAQALEKAIRERDEAQKTMAQAKADAKHAEDSRSKMESDMAALKHLHQLAVGEAKKQKEAEANVVQATEEATAKLQAELDAMKAPLVDVAVMAVDREALNKAKAEAAAEL